MVLSSNAIKKDLRDKDKKIRQKYELSASKLPTELFKLKIIRSEQLLSLFPTLRKEYSRTKAKYKQNSFAYQGKGEYRLEPTVI